MTEFQKIAIGLLGLTNPEMFIPRPKTSATEERVAPQRGGAGPGGRAMRAFKSLITALAIGPRTVGSAAGDGELPELRPGATLRYRAE